MPSRPPLKVLRALMEEAGFSPSSTRGQNFLIEEPILRKIVEEAMPLAGRVVLEVGTGLGFLTSHLAEVAARVVTVEVDDRLHRLAGELARDWGAGAERTVFVKADVLAAGSTIAPEVRSALRSAMAEVAAEDFTVVSNLPYSVAGPVVASLVLMRAPPGRMVLLCQRELADRFLAGPGSKEHGPLSVLISLGYEGRIVRRVPAQAFRPRPKVESVVIALARKPAFPSGHPDGELRAFSGFLRALFGGRRKALRAALARALELQPQPQPHLQPPPAASGIVLPPEITWSTRPEDCSAAALLRIFRESVARGLITVGDPDQPPS
jgi:16S rRNA (adenine1518-N6/adenine1519-N6)-dimethyltransferase